MRLLTVCFVSSLLLLTSPPSTEANGPRFGQQRGWAGRGGEPSQCLAQNQPGQRLRLRDGSCNQGGCPRFAGQSAMGQGWGRQQGWRHGWGMRGRWDGGNAQPSNRPCDFAPPATQPAISQAVLSNDDRALLLGMRREDKLAHDVYLTLGTKFDLMPFRNIPRSELMHQQMMVSLLSQYGVADPLKDLPEGKFDDPAVQALFEKLVAAGSESEIAALKVGAEIEEMDIKDLRAVAAKSSNSAIKDACARLESASCNHLRAFMRNLVARGATYHAQHLQQSELDRIVETQ